MILPLGRALDLRSARVSMVRNKIQVQRVVSDTRRAVGVRAPQTAVTKCRVIRHRAIVGLTCFGYV